MANSHVIITNHTTKHRENDGANLGRLASRAGHDAHSEVVRHFNVIDTKGHD